MKTAEQHLLKAFSVSWVAEIADYEKILQAMENYAGERQGADVRPTAEDRDYYQELFNYMSGEHNILLLESDMFEIVDIVKKILAQNAVGEMK